MAGWVQDPSSEWSTLPPISLVRPALLSSCVKGSRKWRCPLHRSLRRSNKRMLTWCWAQCAHRHCLLSLFGVSYFIKTPWTRFFGLLGRSLICLSIKKCLKLSKFFFDSIFCHWLHSSPNHTKLSLLFPQTLRDSDFLFFANDNMKPPFELIFTAAWSFLLTSASYQIGQISLIRRHPRITIRINHSKA